MKVEDLMIGDYYVYSKYGVCQYKGEEIMNDGLYYLFHYKNKRQCFITKQQVGTSVFFYAEGTKEDVKLSNMDNKASWKKKKCKAMEEVKKTASQLTELYIKRQTLKGYAFSKDTTDQKKFEDNFPFQMSSGQIKALNEIKTDMESLKPMFTLLEADVGYGKTMMAQCLSFKAVHDKTQVVLIAPTSILALQHYNDFCEVFSQYKNINIQLMNSNVSKKNKAIIKDKLEDGTIDIIIATTSILFQDIKFKNLQLLIIDEEHLYGVKDKEKISQQSDTDINIIYMSGTPIPRTLSLAKAGIIHLVTIDTPPQNKKPIITKKIRWDDKKIKDIINEELERKGQVYFVYNNVIELNNMKLKLVTLLPGIKIETINGKMNKKEIKNIMNKFNNQEIDVLIATTIISTGINNKNANLILIYSPENYGLSQLYQLRGRVSRGNIQGKCYFVIPTNKIIEDVAQKRLNILCENYELGSNTKISEEDLKLRGEGGLFSDKQHGHTVQIGMDMYNHLMEEEIKRQKEEIA